jgi:hypothetical protein
MMQPLQTLQQVILFRQMESVQELAPLVSSVFEECAQYFGPTTMFSNIETRRLFTGAATAALSQSRGFGVPIPPPNPDSQPPEQSWIEAKGLFRNTMDPAKLVSIAKQELPFESGLMLIVTDQEITPPPQWRYKMWSVDESQHAIVVSLVPMDPRSWSSESDDQDLQVLKQRIRSACIRRLARWCGLQECDRETCYLFRHVESAEALDFFTSLGSEHGSEAPQFAPILELEFEPAGDPFAVEVLRQQRFRGEAFYA